MNFSFLPFLAPKITARALGLLLLSGISAGAWPWNSEPQPLLHDRTAIRADAGSPLAWDRSARVLWFVRDAGLHFAYWNGTTFIPKPCVGIVPNGEAGMLVDEAWHLVYFLDADGHLCCARRSQPEATWFKQVIGGEFLKRLLAVDNRTHSVFAYDPIARGIRQYTYQVKTKAWSSSVIASGLGAAGDAAAWDSSLRVLYSSHATAEATVPRAADTHLAVDPTGIGAWQPWPLVATTWDGKKWSSRVLDETGVPQLPAVRATDHTVFYARRDDVGEVRTFRPSVSGRPEVFGAVSGWSGADTYEDHDRYEIKAPHYPEEWNGGSVTTWAGFTSFYLPSLRQLQGPITVIPYYEPVWTETPLPARLAHFRAVVNPKQNRLVQHREIYAGEIVREQTGKRLAGYLYRDAVGVLAVRGRSVGNIREILEVEISYPALTDSFDPANPPAEFAGLADPTVRFFARIDDTSATVVTQSFWGGLPLREISTLATTDANSPFVAAHLLLPTSVQLRTFGHRYSAAGVDQPGGRFRHYHNYGTSYATLSSIAGDAPSGVTFYIQAPEPSASENTQPSAAAHSSPPLAGFRAPSDFKQSRPASSVWIVMVY